MASFWARSTKRWAGRDTRRRGAKGIRRAEARRLLRARGPGPWDRSAHSIQQPPELNVAGGIADGEVDEQRLALDVGGGREAPVAAVLRVVAVVAHHEVLPGRHGHGAVFLGEIVGPPGAFGRERLEEMRVRLVL